MGQLLPQSPQQDKAEAGLTPPESFFTSWRAFFLLSTYQLSTRWQGEGSPAQPGPFEAH